MNWLQLLNEIFEVCVIPLLGVLTAFLVKVIRVKTEEIKQKSSNDKKNYYIDLLSETIVQCVTATNQTYVNALKDKDAFDEDAQKEAFTQTYQAVISILSDTAKENLSTIYGDLKQYIVEKIEAEVNNQKNS